MHKLLEDALREYDVFSDELPEIVNSIVKAIPSDTIPVRLKQAIAISEIVRYASQFHIHIHHWNNSIIPINTIIFGIAKSGASKDSSVSYAKECFAAAYKNHIELYRNEEAIDKAIEAARADGCDAPDNWNVYKNYYVDCNPLVVGISTLEGFLLHLNELSKSKYGSGFLYNSELGSSFSSNPNFTDCIISLAELFDMGNKELKVLKDKSKQTIVKGVAVSALLLGSQDNILYDANVKAKFRTEFSTKLARRSFFIYASELLEKTTFTSAKEIIEYDRNINKRVLEARCEVSEYTEELAAELLRESHNSELPNLVVDEEAQDLVSIYQRYNAEEADKIDAQFPIMQLSRRHNHWKALKLAGAFAIIRRNSSITVEDYVYAIRFTEIVAKDLLVFEKDLAKEPYEAFVDYSKSIAKDNEASIGLHTLRKLNFITGANPTTKMKELVQLANSCTKDASYRVEEDNIICSIQKLTDDIVLSYLEVPKEKEKRFKVCDVGYETEIMKFEDLVNMLEGDYAYSPFEYAEGKRGKDNVINGCKWLVFDIDKSEITDQECHLLLNNYKHIIVRTSDAHNQFKFRVLLELDAEIDIPDIKWGIFTTTVANSLGLNIDKLAKSQCSFSYSSSKDTIMTNFDGELLQTKPFLDKIYSEVHIPATAIAPNKKKSLLGNPLDTFSFAYEATKGGRSISLIRAAKYAKDLGMEKEQVLNLMESINNYWTNPLEPTRIESTIQKQIDRWSF